MVDWSAIATLVAGVMAVGAAWWTVEQTRRSADKTDNLLREQIDVQRQEISLQKRDIEERARAEKLNAAYTLFQMAGAVESALTDFGAEFEQGQRTYPDHLRPAASLVGLIREAYPSAVILSREDHIHFQVIDVVGRGLEQINDADHLSSLREHANALRLSLTPMIVSLPSSTRSKKARR